MSCSFALLRVGFVLHPFEVNLPCYRAHAGTDLSPIDQAQGPSGGPPIGRIKAETNLAASELRRFDSQRRAILPLLKYGISWPAPSAETHGKPDPEMVTTEKVENTRSELAKRLPWPESAARLPVQPCRGWDFGPWNGPWNPGTPPDPRNFKIPDFSFFFLTIPRGAGEFP
jgi:hypothetical protein